jgi:hypothetical protein
MEAMRESWTDERLDDFRAETARRFDAVDKRFDAVDRRFDTLERRMEDGFSRAEGRIDALHHAIHRTMLQLGVGLIATVAVGFAGIILSQL